MEGKVCIRGVCVNGVGLKWNTTCFWKYQGIDFTIKPSWLLSTETWRLLKSTLLSSPFLSYQIFRHLLSPFQSWTIFSAVWNLCSERCYFETWNFTIWGWCPQNVKNVLKPTRKRAMRNAKYSRSWYSAEMTLKILSKFYWGKEQFLAFILHFELWYDDS